MAKGKIETSFGEMNYYLREYNNVPAVWFSGEITINRVEYKARIEFKYCDGQLRRGSVSLSRTDGVERHSWQAHDKFEEEMLQHAKRLMTPTALREAHTEAIKEQIESWQGEIETKQNEIKMLEHWIAEYKSQLI